MRLNKLPIFLILFFLSFNIKAEGKKVLMVIAFENFRDEELSIPKNIFEKNGIGVDIASIKKGTAKGMLGLKTNVNLTIDEVKETDYDCIVLVGGIGVEGLFKNQEVIKLVQNFYKSKKIIGAICLAPGILANAGVLNGKKATGFHTVSTLLKEKGAIFTGKEVEVDGNIVTANGPGAAERFGNEILKLLKK